MKLCLNRLWLGLAGLFVFSALDMLSANELAKSSLLMATSLPGIAGLFIVIAYFRARPRWLSGASLLIIFMFFLDAAIKGFLREHFGLRPNPTLVLQAIFNSNPAETSEFLAHNWRDLAQGVALLVLVASLTWWAERIAA